MEAVLQTLTGHTGSVNAVAYSPRGIQATLTLMTSATTTGVKPTSATLGPIPKRDGSLPTVAKVGIGVGVGVVIALGVGSLLLLKIRKRASGVAPVERSQERLEKSELHHSDLPRTHGRAELEAHEPISELEGFPAEGKKMLHKPEEVLEKGTATE
jgi:hypothetical protein